MDRLVDGPLLVSNETVNMIATAAAVPEHQVASKAKTCRLAGF